MDNKSEIERLEREKREIQSQISDIQKSCKHTESYIAFVVDDNGTNQGAMVHCSNCKQILRYPTKEELDEWCS